MKTQKLISILALMFVVVFSLNFASAIVNINFPAYNATLNNDTTVTYYNSTGNTQKVSGFDALAYQCTTTACTAYVGASISATTAGDTITIAFPTLAQNASYGIYFYKIGYIGWEQIITNISANLNGDFNGTQVFFAKKQTGFAPIMNLSVAEEILTGMPIRIGFNVSIDADTYAAISNAGPLVINPAALDPFKMVQTLVTLEIRNATNGLTYTANQVVNIPYSSSVPINFDYTGFANTGSYSVNVFTDVTDAKILNSIRLQAQAGINVIPQNLTNYTFTLIQNLNMVPALPVQGDNVVFSFNYNSGFVNESGALLSANTTLNMTIYQNSVQIWNNLVNNGSSGNYIFNYTFANPGSYGIVVAGSPNDARGNLTIPSSQTINFVISASGPTSDNGDDDDSGSIVTGEDKNKIAFDTGTPGNESVISLSKPEDKTFNAKKLIFWLILLILLLIIIIAVVYAMKR